MKRMTTYARKMILPATLGVGILCFLPITRAVQNEATHRPVKVPLEIQEALRQLRLAMPEKPAVASAGEIQLMAKLARTRHPAAIPPLIRALAFNRDPGASNEKTQPSPDQSQSPASGANEARSLEEMIPAMGLLREYYGKSAIEPLVTAGAETEHDWLRDRIAATIRIIEPDVAVRKKLADQIEARFVASAQATKLSALLLADMVDIKLASTDQDLYDALDKRIDQIKARNAANKN